MVVSLKGRESAQSFDAASEGSAPWNSRDRGMLRRSGELESHFLTSALTVVARSMDSARCTRGKRFIRGSIGLAVKFVARCCACLIIRLHFCVHSFEFVRCTEKTGERVASLC